MKFQSGFISLFFSAFAEQACQNFWFFLAFEGIDCIAKLYRFPILQEVLLQGSVITGLLRRFLKNERIEGLDQLEGNGDFIVNASTLKQEFKVDVLNWEGW